MFDYPPEDEPQAWVPCADADADELIGAVWGGPVPDDGGCTFPGWRRPAGWTTRHHVREHRFGGRTSRDNLALLCRYHHHTFEATGRGW